MKSSPRSTIGPLEMRSRIVKAALEIIASEGFGAVTAPRLAEEIGLRRPIIYYYFQDIDDIAIEAIRLSYQQLKLTFLRQLDDRGPSQIMWDMLGNAAAPMAEFTALALRKEKFKSVYQEVISDLRATFSEIFHRGGLPGNSASHLDADGYALLIQIASIALGTERKLELSAGHATLKKFLKMLKN